MASGTSTAAVVIAFRVPAHLAQHAAPTIAAFVSYQDGFLVAGVVGCSRP